MSQQLVKKGANGRMEHVNPKSWIEAIKDKNTGQTLVEILQGFNMYFLPYNGNTSSTRCLVPTMLRKKGLWITYVKYDGNVYTEWYAASGIDDKSWGDSSNWRVGNNTLVGDITISANGNWVINGTETEFKAVGEKGNTPLIRVANNRLQVSYDLGDTYIDVTNNPVYTKFRWLATSGDTQANNVGRIQASTDEGKTWTNMSNDFTNNLHIKKYIGVNESLPTSGIAEGTIYAKGPYYAEDDTLNDNPIYRLWVYAWKGNTLAWQDNGEFQSIAAGVVQETGNSETQVMSQAAVTRELSELSSKVGIYYKSEDGDTNYSFPFLFESGKYYEIQIDGYVSAIYTSNSPTWDKDRVDTIEAFKGVFIFTPSSNASYFSYWALSSVDLSIIEVSTPLFSKIKEVEDLSINSQVTLYFAGNEKPSFEFGEDYIKVKGLSNDMYGRLYNSNNKQVRNFTIKSEEEYIINRYSVLSLRSTELEVSNFVDTEYDDLNNIPLLFYNADGVLSGIMSPYAISAYNSMIINGIKDDIDGFKGIVSSTSGNNSQIIPFNIQANKTYKLLFLEGSYTTAYTTNNNTWGESGRVDVISTSGQKEVEFTASKDAAYISFWQSSQDAKFALGELPSFSISIEEMNAKIDGKVQLLNEKYSKLYDNDNFLYFAAAYKPNFKIDSDNAVVITFPSSDFYARLYNKDFKVVKSFIIPALSEYKIGKYEVLVLINNSLQVVNFTNGQIEDGILLFVGHADGVYSGSLAPYYYDWLNNQSKPDGTGIMDLFPKTSYLPKIATIRRQTPYGYSPTNTPLVLMCISDVHGNNTNVDRFNDWFNTYKDYVDDRINLGDTTTNDLGQYELTSAKYFSEHDGVNILHQVGNHDVVISGTSTNYWEDGDVTSKEVFDKFTGLLNKEELGLVFPENAEANGYNYYYKDYVGKGISTKGIRLIMLDTAIENTDYISTQLAWLQSILNDALSKQYSVVCATHFPPNKVTQFNFKNKGIVTGFASTDEVKTFSKYIPSRWHDAVDSFIDDGGDFITWISGHVHNDYLGTIVGHERQLSICITTGSPRSYNAEKHEPARLDGTITQDAFNHIAFDTYSGKISMVRVGYNFDNFGRPIDMICVDYKNKEVIV